MKNRGVIISKSSLLRRMKASKFFQPTMHSNLSSPSSSILVPVDPLETASIILRNSSIRFVLSMTAFPEIASSIVQSIVVLVIALFFQSARENDSMHKDVFPLFTSSSIEAVGVFIPHRTPIRVIQPFKIVRIYKRILAFSQGDYLVRLIWRLSDCVSFHAAGINSFWHRSTSNGLLQLNRYFNIYASNYGEILWAV